MFDPDEGVGPDGEIRTGAHRSRVAAAFEPVLAAAVGLTSTADQPVSTYVYGSVATGKARLGYSDVDLLTVGLSQRRAKVLRRELSERFADLCRGVEIAVAGPQDYVGDGDDAYGNQVFLRHYCVYLDYCVHLAGPDISAGMEAFPADVRAARGFNGDIGASRAAWVDLVHDRASGDASEPGVLGRRMARKTLLAVAGLVSVHDGTWTTDRGLAARRWAEVRPAQRSGLGQLLRWSEGQSTADRDQLEAVLSAGAVIELVVRDFQDLVGLWD